MRLGRARRGGLRPGRGTGQRRRLRRRRTLRLPPRQVAQRRRAAGGGGGARAGLRGDADLAQAEPSRPEPFGADGELGVVGRRPLRLRSAARRTVRHGAGRRRRRDPPAERLSARSLPHVRGRRVLPAVRRAGVGRGSGQRRRAGAAQTPRRGAGGGRSRDRRGARQRGEQRRRRQGRISTRRRRTGRRPCCGRRWRSPVSRPPRSGTWRRTAPARRSATRSRSRRWPVCSAPPA